MVSNTIFITAVAATLSQPHHPGLIPLLRNLSKKFQFLCDNPELNVIQILDPPSNSKTIMGFQHFLEYIFKTLTFSSVSTEDLFQLNSSRLLRTSSMMFGPLLNVIVWCLVNILVYQSFMFVHLLANIAEEIEIPRKKKKQRPYGSRRETSSRRNVYSG